MKIKVSYVKTPDQQQRLERLAMLLMSKREGGGTVDSARQRLKDAKPGAR